MAEEIRAEREELSEGLLSLLSASESFERALADLPRLVCGATSWAYCEAWLPAGERLVRRGSYALPEAASFESSSADVTIAPAEGFVGRAWERGRPEWVPDLAALPPEQCGRCEAAIDAGFQSAVAVPLTVDDEVLAVLAFFAPARRDPDEQLLSLLAATSTQLAALLVRDRLESRVTDEDDTSMADVIEASPVGVFVVDSTFGIEHVNPRAATLLGMSPDEIRRLSYEEVALDLRDEEGEPVPDADRPVQVVMRTGQPVLDQRYSALRRDGDRVYCSINAAPIRNAAGDVEKVVVVFLDVGERKEYEVALERKNRELESFASVLSHDLRNPLNVATGYLELVRETGDLAYLDPVERAHRRMDQLISDLLLLARRGQAIGAKSTVGLGTVADEAWRLIDAPAGELLLDDDLGTVHADESRVAQLFENLFRNSVEHAGPDVTVRVCALDGRGFAVEDDGPGIPADRRESVLELATDPDHGVRLGLSIVKAIAEAHGWTLAITDAEASPTGVRFEFRFGRGRAGPADAAGT